MGGSIRPELSPSQQDKCMPWTNEKHNRYLDYLEASFVRQLHSSMDSLRWCTDFTEMEGNIHQSLPFNLHKSSEEVSSVPYGQCQKINFVKDQPLSLDVYDRQCKHEVRHAVKDSSTDLQELHKLHNRDKNMKRIKSNCYKRSSLEDSYLSRFCHRSSDESVVECTDQNFVDDGCQKLSPKASRAKKLKIAAREDTPDGDQIPFGELYSSDKPVLGIRILYFENPPSTLLWGRGEIETARSSDVLSPPLQCVVEIGPPRQKQGRSCVFKAEDPDSGARVFITRWKNLKKGLSTNFIHSFPSEIVLSVINR